MNIPPDKLCTLQKDLISKYGFLLSLVKINNTNNFQNDFYRVRIPERKDEVIKGVSQLTYRKENVKPGRCNLIDEPVFYCSDKSTTAFAEILQNSKNLEGRYAYLSVWNLKPNVDFNIFPFLESAKRKGIIKNGYELHNVHDSELNAKSIAQLLEIEKYFYRSNSKSEYSVSGIVSNILFNRKLYPCDCIFYPSALETELGINIAIKESFVDKYLYLKRAYKFHISGVPKNYKWSPIEITFGNDIIWKKLNYHDLYSRTIINQDINL